MTERCQFGSTAYQECYAIPLVKVDMFQHSVLPCLCIIARNVVLGRKLIVTMNEAKDKFATRKKQNKTTTKTSSQKKVLSVTVTIVIVSVAFLVITVPFMINSTFFFGYRSSEIHVFLHDFSL